MREGSDLAPAPREEKTGILCEWQYASSSTLESMLSMQSIT